VPYYRRADHTHERTRTMPTMTHAEIVAYLSTYLSRPARLVTRDATGDRYLYLRVWLDDDGVLVQSHPTDDRSGPIAAPIDGDYHAGD